MEIKVPAADDSSPQPVNAQSLINQFLDAQNAHDVDAVIGMFADDATVTLRTETLSGKTEILEWQQDLIAGRFHITLQGDVKLDGARITFSAIAELDKYKALGLSRLDYECEALIKRRKIQNYSFTPSPEAQARFEAALAKVQPSPESS